MKIAKIITVSALTVALLAGCSQDIKLQESEEKSKEVVQNVEKNVEENTQKTAFTEEEIKYLDVLNTSMQTFSEKMSNISELTSQPIENPTIVNDEEWIKQLSGNFLTIVLLGKMLSDMDKDGVVPEKLREIHNTVQDAFETMGNAGVKMISSVSDTDSIEFRESIQLVDESKHC